MDIVERLRNCAATMGGGASYMLNRTALEAADEIARLRRHLAELGKAADAAAMVIATIEAEDTTEEEGLQKIMDAIGQWAPDAIMGPNVEVSGLRGISRRSARLPGWASVHTQEA